MSRRNTAGLPLRCLASWALTESLEQVSPWHQSGRSSSQSPGMAGSRDEPAGPPSRLNWLLRCLEALHEAP